MQRSDEAAELRLFDGLRVVLVVDQSALRSDGTDDRAVVGVVVALIDGKVGVLAAVLAGLHRALGEADFVCVDDGQAQLFNLVDLFEQLLAACRKVCFVVSR